MSGGRSVVGGSAVVVVLVVVTHQRVGLRLAAVQLGQVELGAAIFKNLHRRNQLTSQVKEVDFIA